MNNTSTRNHKFDIQDFVKKTKPSPTFILSLTRCCTQNCTFCAVDALYCRSVQECCDRAQIQQTTGKELTPEQWCSVIDKLLAIDTSTGFDLSGGDCLALPWVYRRLIPHILERVDTRKQVSVTSTAESLQAWLEDANASSVIQRPGAIHVTFDGYRPYSFENIRLATQIHELGVDLHIECPLTKENCSINKINEIYNTAKDAKVREILLMPYFPVGRGGNKYLTSDLAPSSNVYSLAIAEFFRLAALQPSGPIVKVQCALKKFSTEGHKSVRCKMGEDTWCVMPNGTLIICPWAYGLGGNALDDVFVAGNILLNDFTHCQSKAEELRILLQNRYPEECRVMAFVDESRSGVRQQVLQSSKESIIA